MVTETRYERTHRPAEGPDSVFSRILVGTDGRAGGDEGVRQGARLAVLTSADLEVVHVMRPTGLVHEAEERSADLLCVGADARFMRKAGLPGFVAAQLARQFGGSLLVARAGHPDRGFPESVVAGVEDSMESLQAVWVAAALARTAGARLELLHVVAPDEPVSGDAFRPDAEPGPVRSAATIARAMDVEPRIGLGLGSAGPTLCDLAAIQRADLIVVGARPRDPIRRALGAGVAEWVAMHAACSVLVVRRDGR